MNDTTAALLYQIAIIFVIAAICMLLVANELNQQTNELMRPFQEVEKIAEKKAKVVAVKLPSASKSKQKDKEEEKKKEKEKGEVESLKADFRVGRWGTKRDTIATTETALLMNADSPYFLDYFGEVSGYNAAARYEFSSNNLTGGRYIVLGDPCIMPDSVLMTAPRIGETITTSAASVYGLFKEIKNPELANLENIENLFDATLIGLVTEYGVPKAASRDAQDQILTKKEKILGIMARNKMLYWCWGNKRTKVELTIAGYQMRFCMIIAFSDKREMRE